jgi:hypothetical protein
MHWRHFATRINWEARKNFWKMRIFKEAFTGDFDLPKRICLNGLFWCSFDKVRHFLSRFSTLVTSQKKDFLHFLMHREVILKNDVLQVFLSNLNIICFWNFEKIFNFEYVRAKNVVFSLIFWCVNWSPF